jgi:hypothetical protein
MGNTDRPEVGPGAASLPFTPRSLAWGWRSVREPHIGAGVAAAEVVHGCGAGSYGRGRDGAVGHAHHDGVRYLSRTAFQIPDSPSDTTILTSPRLNRPATLSRSQPQQALDGRILPVTDGGISPALMWDESVVSADGAALACPLCGWANLHLDMVHFAMPVGVYEPVMGLDIDTAARVVMFPGEGAIPARGEEPRSDARGRVLVRGGLPWPDRAAPA